MTAAEVLRPVGDEFELAGLDLAAVLRAGEFLHLGRDAVDGAVEALCLCVEHVGEAPEQGLALVGELGAVDGNAGDDDADRLVQRFERLVAVPDVAAVELSALGGGAVEGRLLAGGGGRGLPVDLRGGVADVGVGAVDVVHEVLH